MEERRERIGGEVVNIGKIYYEQSCYHETKFKPIELDRFSKIFDRDMAVYFLGIFVIAWFFINIEMSYTFLRYSTLGWTILFIFRILTISNALHQRHFLKYERF